MHNLAEKQIKIEPILIQGPLSNIPERYLAKLEEEHQRLNEIAQKLSEQISAIGCSDVRFEDFVKELIPLNDHHRASQKISLQTQVAEFLKELEKFKEIASSICLEPAKLHLAVDAAEKLLIDRMSGIYQRSGRLCHLITKPASPNGKLIKRRADTLAINEVSLPYVIEVLTKAGSWIRFDVRTDTLKRTDCPDRLGKHLLARGQWNLPVLTGIIGAPTLRPDGSILDSPGYDHDTGLFFDPNSVDFGNIPQNPSKQEAISALLEIEEIIIGFPFEGDESKSVALSAILTGLIRRSIATAPLHGFSAPKMASGKSLLADVVSLIATGRPNTVLSHADNETEERKRLLAVLMDGDPVICFDNIEKPFASSALCSILTQREYKDRILGETRNTSVLTNALFLATGNNLTFAGDLSTRTILCKLDPKTERPEERAFDVDLHAYIPEHRARLVRAGLVVLRAYHIACRPAQDIKPYGRFEEWSNWIRAALVWLGRPDPCTSRKEIENADPVRIQLGNLLAYWHEAFADHSHRLKDVIKLAEERKLEDLKDSLNEIADDGKGGVNVRKLGKKFAAFKNRIENGFRLESKGSYQGVETWRVKKV